MQNNGKIHGVLVLLAEAEMFFIPECPDLCPPDEMIPGIAIIISKGLIFANMESLNSRKFIANFKTGNDREIPKVISDVALSYLPAITESNVAEFYKTLIERRNGQIYQLQVLQRRKGRPIQKYRLWQIVLVDNGIIRF